MTSSLKNSPERADRNSLGRDHVRRAGEQAKRRRSRSRGKPKPMTPLSQTPAAAGSSRVAGRRASRKENRARVQVQRDTPKVRRRGGFHRISWRLVSGMIVLGLSVVLYLFLTSDVFYISSVAIGGEKYLTREEIFRFSDVAKQHIFWIDSKEVEQVLEEVPNIADAQVYVGWPPDMVQIIVTEREPALIWEENVRVWVDINGIVMKQREDRPDLLRIVVPDAEEPVEVGTRIPQTVIDGALQLRRRYPNIDVLLYDPYKGLGYRDGQGWTVWFGSGDEIDVKLTVYLTLVDEILAQGIQPGEIVMSDPDRPYYTILWREGS